MSTNLNSLEMMSKEELLDFAKKMVSGGIALSFNGKRTAQVIERKVMPRIVKIDKKLSFNSNEGNNIIIDGENLQAMVTLYKYKGQIDLIVTDPPYNTGKNFRYNDRWDTDPNDPDLGELVTLEDGSRHTKWIKFMLPRIQMMKAMLKPNGVLAICIDECEFFHLGMLLKDVFKSILEEVRKTLSIDIPEISISYHIGSGKNKIRPTEKPRHDVEVPDIAIVSDRAISKIKNAVDKMIDYSKDDTNTIGEGSTIKVITDIGSNEDGQEVTTTTTHSNSVTVRWIFKRELDKLAKNAITICDISASKFDALVEYSSNAASYVKEEAAKVAGIYRQNSIIMQNPLDTVPVGEVIISDENVEFKNSVHARYSDFNDFELDFAKELDKTGLIWMRNPKNGILKIKLLDGKGTDNFNPDFIVWTDNTVYALDTKGSHLIHIDSLRKLFYLEKACDGKDLVIKLISEKKYNVNGQVLDQNGYTVWQFKQGQISPITCSTIKEAVDLCVI